MYKCAVAGGYYQDIRTLFVWPFFVSAQIHTLTVLEKKKNYAKYSAQRTAVWFIPFWRDIERKIRASPVSSVQSDVQIQSLNNNLCVCPQHAPASLSRLKTRVSSKGPKLLWLVAWPMTPVSLSGNDNVHLYYVLGLLIESQCHTTAIIVRRHYYSLMQPKQAWISVSYLISLWNLLEIS